MPVSTITGSEPTITMELMYTCNGCPSASCTWWITHVSSAIFVGGTAVVGARGGKVGDCGMVIGVALMVCSLYVV